MYEAHIWIHLLTAFREVLETEGEALSSFTDLNRESAQEGPKEAAG